MLSKMGERIKKFYDDERWTKQQVHDAVGAKVITSKEYKIITGEEHAAPQ